MTSPPIPPMINVLFLVNQLPLRLSTIDILYSIKYFHVKYFPLRMKTKSCPNFSLPFTSFQLNSESAFQEKCVKNDRKNKNKHKDHFSEIHSSLQLHYYLCVFSLNEYESPYKYTKNKKVIILSGQQHLPLFVCPCLSSFHFTSCSDVAVSGKNHYNGPIDMAMLKIHVTDSISEA